MATKDKENTHSFLPLSYIQKKNILWKNIIFFKTKINHSMMQEIESRAVLKKKMLNKI